MSARLKSLRSQFSDVKAGIDKLESAAVAAGRDLTDAEQADVDKLYDRAAKLQPQIEEAAAQVESLNAVTDVLARVNGGEPTTIDRAAAAARPELPELTAGEFLAEFYKAHHPEGSSTPEQFLDRAARYIDRAQQLSADTLGIIPIPIVGPVIKLADSLRPVFNSMSQRTMPSKGKTFERPFITQRVAMGTQTEGQALATQKMVVDSDTVTKATQGGYLDISHQDIDWSEPEALQLLVQDFVDMYAEWTEGKACDALEALATNTSPYVGTDVGTIVDSYVDAFVAVYNSAKRFPDTVWHSLDAVAVLAGTTNTNDDRTAASMVREALRELGVGEVRWITGPQLASGTRIVGASSLVEAYEQQKGLLRAELPSTLTVQLAYAGYTAHYGKAAGFVSLEVTS